MPSRIEGFTSTTNMSCNAHIGDDVGMLKHLKRCLQETVEPKTWLSYLVGRASIVIFSADDWDVQSPPKRVVFGFRYHSIKR